MARVLVVEDQPDLANGLAEHLTERGHQTQVALSAGSALELARAGHPDLVILDLMLPDRPGDHVLRTLRREAFDGPILILSARGDETSKLRGFRFGADDYVTKPFSLLVLLARVDNLLRRVTRTVLPDYVTLGGRIEIWPKARRVSVDGVETQLRPREMDLLLALLKRPNEAVDRDELLAEVWGYGPKAQTRTLDWHVAELRRKIELVPSHPELIETVRKVGYRLNWSAAAELGVARN